MQSSPRRFLGVHRVRHLLAATTILGAMACSGGVTCSACGGVPLDPIPGGFDPNAQIDRAAQARLTTGGTQFIGGRFQDLAKAFASMECGPGEVACPDRFTTSSGAPAPTACDPVNFDCRNALGETEPVIGFAIERTESNGAIICRDLPTDAIPAVRECAAWMRLEGLQLVPTAPDEIQARVTVQIYTTPIPLRYETLQADCLLEIDSNRGSSRFQDFELTAKVRPWPDGGQLEVAVTDVATPSIEPDDLTIQRDALQADGLELACAIANIQALQPIIIGLVARQLGDVIDTEIHKVLGQQCLPFVADCAPGTICNDDGLCENAEGIVVPAKLGAEGRIDLAGLLGGLAPGTLGALDLSFLVGGHQSADATGINIGIKSGMEVANRDASCALDLPSPRLRPGFIAPPALPADTKADLDFDGVPETSFMVSAAISDALVDQAIWSTYQTGMFCQNLSSYDIALLNTGSLSVLIPSLRQLTHSDFDSTSIWPAAIRMSPGGEPRIRLGSGEVRQTGNGTRIVDPLLRLQIPDLHIDFSAIVEERWVHLMTLEADVELPLGIIVTPANELEIVIGNLEDTVTDIHVTQSEILAESAAELEETIPALLGSVLPDLTQSLAVPLALPSGSDLGGFTLDVLGIRGVAVSGQYRFAAVYADLGFDPALAPTLLHSVETSARLVALDIPTSERMAVTAEEAPKRPSARLQVAASSPRGVELEHQYRLDGGPWSFFERGDQLVVQRPELLVQGVHHLEIRAREVGNYRSLDPSPASFELRIDSEPPTLEAVRVESGARVRVSDIVSGSNVDLFLETADQTSKVNLDSNGFLAIEATVFDAGAVLRAVDEAGLASEVVLSSSMPTIDQTGSPASCHCSATHHPMESLVLVLLLCAFILRGARLLRKTA